MRWAIPPDRSALTVDLTVNWVFLGLVMPLMLVERRSLLEALWRRPVARAVASGPAHKNSVI